MYLAFDIFLVGVIIFLGIFLTVSNNANLPILSKKCAWKNLTLVAFKNCIHEITPPFIRQIKAGLYKERLHLNERFTSKIIIPSEGSIGSKQKLAPTFVLDPKYQYNLYLFDQDFNLFLNNPSIVQRSFTKISPNGTFVSVYMQESHGFEMVYNYNETTLGHSASNAQHSSQSL